MHTINFLDPIFYDISDVPDDVPNRAHLEALFDRMNEQNERLWEFFTDMVESPTYRPMKAEAIKPRSLRRKRKPNKNQYKLCEHTGRYVKKSPAVDDPDSEEFMAGYKEFLKEEFGDS